MSFTFFMAWGHAHCSWGGGGGGFRPLALKKPLRKTCLPGIFNLLLVGHSNVIIILDLPVLLELNWAELKSLIKRNSQVLQISGLLGLHSPPPQLTLKGESTRTNKRAFNYNKKRKKHYEERITTEKCSSTPTIPWLC